MNYNCVVENSIEFLLWMKYLSLSFFYLSSFLVPNGVLISIQLFSLPISWVEVYKSFFFLMHR